MIMNQPSEQKLLQNSIAMTVTLISFAMLFASMFLGYFLVRYNAPVWPPVEIQNRPQLLPFLSTLVIVLSSFTYYKLEKGNNKKSFWFLTFALGLAFLALQWLLWKELGVRGITVGNGNVPSMVYAFSWIHAAHIILGLFALIYLGWFIFRRTEKLTVFKLINVGKFWHFLGVVWILMYLMMFVL